jgi:mono/diheme cytochrome c family protein
MKHVACLSMVLLMSAAATAPLQAQQAGDARQGLALARQVCFECHAIQPQQLQSPNPRAPTFPQLAATPGMTTAALTVALTTPHVGMPMFRLSSEQREDIIAYILSLRGSGVTPGK